MRVWRLARRVHAALDGEGARLAGGRWNSPGRPVVYTARHLSLAALELLVHVDSDTVPADLTAFKIEVPDDLERTRTHEADLPRDWRERLDVTPGIGDTWVDEMETPVLIVPSALVPEDNVLVNPLHADARAVRAVAARGFHFDSRLLAPES